MIRFSKSFIELDQSADLNSKVDVLKRYFSKVSDNDKMWALGLFSNKRPKKVISTVKLRKWVLEFTDITQWLFEECYQTVGDLTETISLIIHEVDKESNFSLAYWMEEILKSSNYNENELKAFVLDAWNILNKDERYIFNKLITGGFRTEVSQKILSKALAETNGVDEKAITFRLSQKWDPQTTSFSDLFSANKEKDKESTPFPYFLAHSIESIPNQLGEEQEWYAELKWDGIRTQLIHRNGRLHIWSRELELITQRLPEFNALNDTGVSNYVLDGALMCLKDDKFLPYNILQSRIKKKKAGKKLLEDAPIVFVAFDILEFKGEDLRSLPLYERKILLEEVVADLSGSGVVLLSPLLAFTKWSDLDKERRRSKEFQSTGVILKKKDSVYQEGRKRGNWWKWHSDPLSFNAVLLYAQRGQGWQRGKYDEYTFAVPDKEGKLVTVVKSYSGLKEEEYLIINNWIRQNTVERFGPVMVVSPELVFEISYKGVLESNRHKSGIVVRSPQIIRWLKEKSFPDIDTLAAIKALL